MRTSWDDSSNMFLSIDTIRTADAMLCIMDQTDMIYGSIDRDFVQLLDEYEKNHPSKKKNGEKVFLKSISIKLDTGYNHSYLIGHIKKFVNENLCGLPVYAYLSKTEKKKEEILTIIVSERSFSKKERTYKEYYASDIYKKPSKTSKGMVFARKDDEGAVKVAKQGDVKREYKSHFSLKNRIFSGNSNDFAEFAESLKRAWISFMNTLNMVFSSPFIKGLSIKKGRNYKTKLMNGYWCKNIRSFNRTKIKINNDLSVLFRAMEGMSIWEEEEIYQDALHLFQKFKSRFMQFEYTKGYLKNCRDVSSIFERIMEDWNREYGIIMRILYESVF